MNCKERTAVSELHLGSHANNVAVDYISKTPEGKLFAAGLFRTKLTT